MLIMKIVFGDPQGSADHSLRNAAIRDTMSGEYLRNLVSNCVEKLLEIDLIVKMVIADQGACNRNTLFGISPSKPYAIIGRRKVFFMHDPHHLLKCVRNNLK